MSAQATLHQRQSVHDLCICLGGTRVCESQHDQITVVRDEAEPLHETATFTSVRLLLLLTAVSSIVITLAGATMLWDGSYYLFNIIEYQSTFMPHHRVGNFLVQWLLAHVVLHLNNVRLSELTLGLSYALIPCASLALSWWVVRKSSPQLIVWPALALIATLPGAINIVSESAAVTWLTWPVVLVALVRPHRFEMTAMAVAVMLLCLSLHPLSAATCVLVAAAMTSRLAAKPRTASLWRAAILPVALVIAGVMRLNVLMDEYDRAASTSAATWTQFDNAVRGLPLMAAIAVIVAGIVVLSGRLRSVAVVATLTAVVVLLVWAAQPAEWAKAVDFRRFTFLFSIPFMVMAIADHWSEGLRRKFAHFSSPRSRFSVRDVCIGIAGVSMLATLSVQAWHVHQARTTITSAITSQDRPCLPLGDLPIKGTVLDHWGTAAIAILVQAPDVRHAVVKDQQACDQYLIDGALPLTDFDTIPAVTVENAWFRFHRNTG